MNLQLSLKGLKGGEELERHQLFKVLDRGKIKNVKIKEKKVLVVNERYIECLFEVFFLLFFFRDLFGILL
jgi:hypothetical protein